LAKKRESFWKKGIKEYVRDATEEKQGKKHQRSQLSRGF